MTQRHSLRRIFAIPALVAAASLVGLVSALVGNGLWDAVSWLGLGVAVVLAAWHGLPRRRRSRPGRHHNDGAAIRTARDEGRR